MAGTYKRLMHAPTYSGFAVEPTGHRMSMTKYPQGLSGTRKNIQLYVRRV